MPAESTAWKNHLEDIRDATKLSDIVEEYLGKRVDKNGVCQCPFHQDKNPSMSVDDKKGMFNCFALGCDAKGDMFHFVMDAYSLSFRDSVDYLADRAGMPRFGDKEKRDFKPRKPKPRAPQASKAFPERFDTPRTVVAAPSTIPWPEPGKPVEMFNHKKGQMKRYTPDRVDIYKTVDQENIAMVMRLHFSKDNRKFYIPARFDQLPDDAPDAACLGHIKGNRYGWVMEGYPKGAHAPLFGEHRAPDWLGSANPDTAMVLIVEGEKTADAAIAAFGDRARDILVLTPMGGGSVPGKADWRRVLPYISALAERSETGTIKFAVWPDNDQKISRPDGSVVDPRQQFTKQILYGLMNDIQALNLDSSSFEFRQVAVPEGARPKWDLADLDEIGWSGEDALEWAANAVVRINIKRLPKETSENTPRQTSDLDDVSPAAGP